MTKPRLVTDPFEIAARRQSAPVPTLETYRACVRWIRQRALESARWECIGRVLLRDADPPRGGRLYHEFYTRALIPERELCAAASPFERGRIVDSALDQALRILADMVEEGNAAGGYYEWRRRRQSALWRAVRWLLGRFGRRLSANVRVLVPVRRLEPVSWGSADAD